MYLRISGLIAVLAFAGIFGSTQSLAQNAYISNQVSNDVSVINTATNKVIATIPGGGDPIGVAVSPDGRRAYITNLASSVSVIDTTNNKVIDTINLNSGYAYGVAVSPDGNHVYVAVAGGGVVMAIDTAMNKVTATIPVDHTPFGVAVTLMAERYMLLKG